MTATRGRTRRLGHKPLALAAAGALTMGGLVAIPAAMAGTTPPYDISQANFAIDVAGVPGAFLDDDEGNIKELGPINGNTTKLGVIHTAEEPMLGLTNPNPQVDLRGAWLDTRADADEDQWLYFAWERDSSNGSGIIMYEFQQADAPLKCDYEATDSTLIAGCNPWENRTAGDFILVWDQQGTTITILKRVFDGTKFEDAPGTALGSAKAAVSADGFYGEAALNLTTDIFGGVQECTAFANVIPGTVTGNSDTADYKDTILADAPTISNCGRVEVTKDAGGENGNFTWTLARDSGDDIRYLGDGPAPGYSASELDEASDTIKDAETDDVEDLKAASDYTLLESGPPDPFELGSINCEVDVDGNGTIAETEKSDITEGGTFPVLVGKTTYCTIVNDLQDGTLVVNKVVDNGNGGTDTAGDFTFQVNGGDDQSFDETADEDDDAETGTWSQTYAAGTVVTVVEDDYSPEYATSYANSANSETDCAQLEVPAGDTVTCTITNDDQQGTLIVNKVVKNDFGSTGTAGDFTFKVNGGDNQSFDETADEDGDPETGTWSQAVDAGTYDVVENPPTDPTYSPSYADDFAGNDPSEENPDGEECVDMVVGLGETVTCTITNTDAQNSPGLGNTVQSWVLRDSFSLTGIRPGADDQDDAFVTFRLFAEATLEEGSTTTYICSAQEGDSIVVEADAGDYSADGTFVRLDLAMAADQGIEVFESGEYYWTAQYSGDTNNQGSTTPCGAEKTEILAADQYVEVEGPPVEYRDDFTP